MFESSKFGRISVVEYFQKMYGISLNYPNLPLIKLKSNSSMPNLMPMEMLAISDRPTRIKKLLKKSILNEVVKVSFKFFKLFYLTKNFVIT